jgi:hypothetical protein
MSSDKTTDAHTISQADVRSLMLCIAGAWLYGTISGGRARELAKALGRTAKDIEDLKFVEARNKESNDAG